MAVLIWGPPISRLWMRNIISNQISKYMETPIIFSDVRFLPFPPAIEFKDVQYQKDTGPLQYVFAEKIRMTIGFSPSVTGRIRLKNVEIVKPTLKFNFSEFAFNKTPKKEKKAFRLPTLRDILKIQIDQIQISETALQFELPGKYFLEIDSHTAGYKRVKGTESWSWSGAGYIKKNNKVNNVEKVEIQAKRRGQKVELLDFVISGSDNVFRMKGQAYPEADLSLSANGDFKDLLKILQETDVLKQKISATGAYRIESHLRGPWDDLSQDGTLTLGKTMIGTRQLERANVEFSVRKNLLKAVKGDINIRNSKAHFELTNIEQNRKARFMVRGENIEYSAVQETIDPAVKSIMESLANVDAEGEIRVKPFSMQGTYHVTTPKMAFEFPEILVPYLPLELKQVDVDGKLNWTMETGAVLEGGVKALGFDGPYKIAFPAAKKVDGNWNFNVTHFENLFVENYPARGKGKVGGGIKLESGNLKAVFSLDIKDLQYNEHEKANLTGDLIFTDKGAEMPNLQIVTQNKKGSAKFAGKFDHGKKGKNSIEGEAKNFDLSWISDLTSRRFAFMEGVRGRGSANISLHGTSEDMEGMILFNSENLFWRNARFKSVDAKIHLQPNGIEVQNAHFVGEGFEINSRGSILNDRYEGVVVKMDKMPIDLLGVPEWFNRYVEIVDGTLYADGSFNDPTLKVNGKLFHSDLQSEKLNEAGTFNAEGPISNLQWNIDAYNKKFKSEGMLNLKNGKRIAAHGELNKFSLFSFLQQTTSSVTGKWNFDGDLKSLKTWNGEFDVASLEIRNDKFLYRIKNAFNLTLKNGIFNLTPFTLADRDSGVTVRGHSDADENLFLTMKGNVPVSLFTLLPLKLTRADGVATVDLAWTGKIQNPILNGTFSTKNAFIQSQFFPHPLEDVEFEATIDQNRIKTNLLTGKLADGKFNASGDLLLPSANSEMRIFLNGYIDQSWIRFPEWLPVLLSGNFVFEGNMSNPLFKGDFVILEGMYKDEWDWKKQILTIGRAARVERIYKQDEETVRFDLNFRSDNGKFVLRNNLATGTMKGEIRLLGNNLDFGLLGQIQILDGEVTFLDKKFLLSPGVVNFTNPDSVQLSFDLNARTRIETANTDIFLDIRTEKGEIHAYLSSNPYKDETTIVSLLTLGVELDDLAVTSGADQGVSLSLLPSVLSGPVQSRLETGLRKIKLIDSFQFVPYFSETTKTTSMRLVVAKALFTKVRLSYSTDIFNTGTENIFAVEHLVNRNVTLSSSLIDNRLDVNQVSTDTGFDVGFDVEFKFDF